MADEHGDDLQPRELAIALEVDKVKPAVGILVDGGYELRVVHVAATERAGCGGGSQHVSCALLVK